MIIRILLWIITSAGIAIYFWVCSLLLESRDAVKWPQTQGQVISSSLVIDHLPKFIDSAPDPMRWYHADVQYEYNIWDKTYRSHRVSMKDEVSRNPKPALKVMNKYRREHEVTIFYNPTDPQLSYLEPWNVGDIFTPLLMGGLLAFLGLFILFNRSVETDKRGVEYYYHWGKIYQKLGKLNKALIQFNKIIELNPYLAFGYFSRGSVYLQQRKLDLAIADFNQALTLDPTDGTMYFKRANAYLGKKEYDKAWVDIQKAREKGHYIRPEMVEEIKKNLSAG